MELVKEDLGKVAITVEKNYWNAIRAYDRLVIVEVMGVGCYLSRKPVPAGIQYDNREYWIKLGVNSGGESSVNVVTEFGDSVELAIAQKTISDRFDGIDIQVASVLESIATILNTNLPNINNTLDSLDESITLTNENLSMLQDDINDHHSKIRRIREDLNTAVETIDLVKGQITELNNSVVTLSNNVTNVVNGCWQSNIRTKPVVYLGNRVTEQADDMLMMSKLNDELGIQTSGIVIKENFLTSSRLRYIIDHPDEFGDGLDLWLQDIIIVQLGSDTETIGSFDGTAVLDIDNPNDYPNTFCGNMSYFLDKLNIKAREENDTKPTVFIVVPPKYNNDAMIEALVNMSQYIDFVLVNPFTSRYDNPCTKNITVEGEVKIVLQYAYIEYWADYVSRVVKCNC
jgi:uncharacterized protein YoxC